MTSQPILDPRRILDSLRAYFWLPLVGIVVGVLLGWVYNNTQSEIFRSSASVLVQPGGLSNPAISDLNTSRQIAGTYQRLLTTQPVLEEIAAESDPAVSPGVIGAALSASVERGTSVLKISAETSDPISAANIANVASTVFVERIVRDRIAEIARLQAVAASQGAIDVSSAISAQLASLETLTIIEPAVPNSAPISPVLRTNMLIGGFIGVVLGLGLAIVVGYYRDVVTGPDKYKRLFTPSLVGVLPYDRNYSDVDGSEDINYQEGLRFLRAQITLGDKTGGTSLDSLMITSPGDAAGKTSVSIDLAMVLASTGKVAIVDLDLRRPATTVRLGSDDSHVGISQFLVDPAIKARDLVVETKHPSLSLIPAGTIPSDPATLLQSPRLTELFDQLKESFEVLIIDSPPILAFADALLIANKAGQSLLVVDSTGTRVRGLDASLERLYQSGTDLRGVIITKFKQPHIPVVGYSGYNYSGYSYGYSAPPRKRGIVHWLRRNGKRPMDNYEELKYALRGDYLKVRQKGTRSGAGAKTAHEEDTELNKAGEV